MASTAQQRIVEEISAEPSYRRRLKTRLDRYRNIYELCGPCESLMGQTAYYCHALAFRMAVWEGEELFARLEKLIATARGLKGFAQEERQIVGNLDNYQKLFEFIWPLQVAEFLTGLHTDVEFRHNGPDLVVTPWVWPNKQFYVECYFYNKHWGIEQFIEDILLAKFPAFELRRRPGRSPQKAELEQMIDQLLSPLAENRADVAAGVVVSAWPSQAEPDWTIAKKGKTYGLRHVRRDPRESYQHFLQESVRNKESSNSLKHQRPNLLAINSLGRDFQNAASSWRNNRFPYIALPDTIDGVWWNSCGYDQPLGMWHGRYMLRLEDHPFLFLIPSTD